MQKLQYASFSPQQVCKHTYKYTETTGVKYHLLPDYPPILASSNSCTKKFMKSKTNAKITICIIFTTTGMQTHIQIHRNYRGKISLTSDYPPILASSNSCTKKFMKSKTNAKITICIIFTTTGMQTHIQIHRNYRGKISLTN